MEMHLHNVIVNVIGFAYSTSNKYMPIAFTSCLASH